MNKRGISETTMIKMLNNMNMKLSLKMHPKPTKLQKIVVFMQLILQDPL